MRLRYRYIQLLVYRTGRPRFFSQANIGLQVANDFSSIPSACYSSSFPTLLSFIQSLFPVLKIHTPNYKKTTPTLLLIVATMLFNIALVGLFAATAMASTS